MSDAQLQYFKTWGAFYTRFRVNETPYLLTYLRAYKGQPEVILICQDNGEVYQKDIFDVEKDFLSNTRRGKSFVYPNTIRSTHAVFVRQSSQYPDRSSVKKAKELLKQHLGVEIQSDALIYVGTYDKP